MNSFKTWLEEYFEDIAEKDSDYREVFYALSEQPSAYTFPFDKNVWIQQVDKLFEKCKVVKPLAYKEFGDEVIVLWMNGKDTSWFVTDKSISKWKFYVHQSTKDQQILRSIKNGASMSYYDLLKNIIQISSNGIKSGEPMTPAAASTWKKIISNKNSEFEIFDTRDKHYVNDIPEKLFASDRFEIFVSRIG